MWHSPATRRGSPRPSVAGDHRQPLSLTPASCWVIASSDGKDSHGNGAAPGVFSHIPPQARVIITFICKTPCKTGKLFSFFKIKGKLDLQWQPLHIFHSQQGNFLCSLIVSAIKYKLSHCRVCSPRALGKLCSPRLSNKIAREDCLQWEVRNPTKINRSC